MSLQWWTWACIYLSNCLVARSHQNATTTKPDLYCYMTTQDLNMIYHKVYMVKRDLYTTHTNLSTSMSWHIPIYEQWSRSIIDPLCIIKILVLYQGMMHRTVVLESPCNFMKQWLAFAFALSRISVRADLNYAFYNVSTRCPWVQCFSNLPQLFSTCSKLSWGSQIYEQDLSLT